MLMIAVAPPAPLAIGEDMFSGAAGAEGGGGGGLRGRRRRGLGPLGIREGFDLPLNAKVVVADLDQIAFDNRGGPLDLVAIDADAVIAAQVFDLQRTVRLPQSRVLARDIAFSQLDRVAILAPDGDLVAHNRDDGLAALVVLDDELHVFLRRLERVSSLSGASIGETVAFD